MLFSNVATSKERSSMHTLDTPETGVSGYRFSSLSSSLLGDRELVEALLKSKSSKSLMCTLVSDSMDMFKRGEEAMELGVLNASVRELLDRRRALKESRRFLAEPTALTWVVGTEGGEGMS
jgi:signal transduction histidine kinase